MSIEQGEKEKWIDLERFWLEHEAEILKNFEQLFETERFSAGQKSPPEKERLELAVERERKFVEMVFEQVNRALAEHPEEKPLVLFDVDETLGCVDYTDDISRGPESSGQILRLRPSIRFVLESLKDKAEIGILTTRSPKGLEITMGEDHNIGALREYINPARVYSTDSFYKIYEKEEGDRSRELFQSLRRRDMSRDQEKIEMDKLKNGEYFRKKFSAENVIRLTRSEKEDAEIVRAGGHKKICALREIKKQNPDQPIVMVDDDDPSAYTTLLNPENGFYGVPDPETVYFSSYPLEFQK